MSESNPLDLPVQFGPGTSPLYQVINWWAYEVLTYRDIAVGSNGHNPLNRWVHDFVGALHIRQAIARALEPNEGVKLPEPASLKAVDSLHLGSTVPDERRFLRLLEPNFDELASNPSWWWWGRFPPAGAVFDEMLAIVDGDTA